jgi:hypothetical protein
MKTRTGTLLAAMRTSSFSVASSHVRAPTRMSAVWACLGGWTRQWRGIHGRSTGGSRLLARGAAHGVASWCNRARQGAPGEETDTSADEDENDEDDEDGVGSGTRGGAWGGRCMFRRFCTSSKWCTAFIRWTAAAISRCAFCPPHYSDRKKAMVEPKAKLVLWYGQFARGDCPRTCA